MQRVDNATAATTLPPFEPPGTPGYWSDGDETTGTKPTIVDQDYMNSLQEELCHVIEAAGLTLNKADTYQLLKAIRALFRTRLVADLDLYIATTGSDLNNGSIGSPFATLQGAWNAIIDTIDLAGYNITIHVATGTYFQGLSAYGAPVGFGSGNTILFLGNPATPGSVTINPTNGHCFNASDGAQINVSGFHLIGSGTLPGSSVPASGLVVNSSGVLGVSGPMDFGVMPGPHMWCSHGQIVVASDYVISGGAQVHLNSSDSGLLIFAATHSTVQINGTPAFPYAFAAAGVLSTLECFGTAVTWNGTASGARYSANLNGVIFTNGAGANFFPGSSAGVVATGGVYA